MENTLLKEVGNVNKAKLFEAEQKFFKLYPGGTENPSWLALAKKHKVEKMHKLTQNYFAPEQFYDTDSVVEAMSKIASQSSLVSVFEKPKYRDLIKELNSKDRAKLAEGLREFLHGTKQHGFELMADLLGEYQLAKWPLLTVFGVYYRPSVEVLVKPTTAKAIIEYFELEGIKYTSKPTYDFYAAYSRSINEMKTLVSPELREDNGAFCGFLMIAMGSD